MSELALQLIEENKKTKDPYLDLGNCGLSELPKELFECDWLEELNLSAQWQEYSAVLKNWDKKFSQNNGSPNAFNTLDNLGQLPLLKKLVVGGDPKKRLKLLDLSPLQNLQNLQDLYVYNTQVADLSPLKNLQNLQNLHIYNTQVADLSPLQNLHNLIQLNISNTQVVDLSPLKNLQNLQYLHVYYTQVVDLSPLKDLQNLQQINASNTQVVDLSPLKDLQNLQQFYVSNTQVADLKPLKDLHNLQQLHIYNTQVTDLLPLQNLHNLQTLHVYNTQVADLSPLQNLHNLQQLNVSSTQVADLSPLKNLQNLQQFNVSDTQVADLSPLQNLHNLQQLNIFSTQVADLSPLQNLQNLQTLYVYNTQIADLSPLQNLQNLQTLYVSTTQVTDLSPLQNFQNLQQLNVSTTQVADLSPVQHLHNLHTLHAYNTQVADLSPLQNLQNLQNLYIYNTQVADLSPLKNLQALQTLQVYSTQVADLSPLKNLQILQTLYVSNTQVADLSPIKDLHSLQYLNTSNTQVADLSPLKNLHNLHNLQVFNTQVADLSPLKNLHNLHSLQIFNTQVADLSPLKNLHNLHNLNISNTKGTDLSPLQYLQNLQSLQVFNTQVADLSPLQNLQNLQQLYISNTQVADLSPLKDLQNLQNLNVSNTHVADLSPLQNLQNLQQLHVGNTRVADLSPLQNLRNLQQLYVFNTQVADLSPLQNLQNLTRLDLRNAKVYDLSPLLRLISNGRKVVLKTDNAVGDEINVYNCPLITPPLAVVQQGNKAILNYFREIETAGEEKGLEAKLLLIGEGQAGKTSLRTRLLKGKEAPLPTKADRTKGLDIEIEQLEFALKNGERMRLNIFDFGGQDHYKPLHQFFYSYRSLYVLVTRNGDESNDFDFWLDTAQLFGGGSPVVVVNNLFGDVPSQFNRSRYSRFDNILKASVDVNLDTPTKGWPETKDIIEFWAEQLPHIHEFIPKTWANVRRAIQEIRHKNIIPLNEFLQICSQPQNGGMNKERALRCSAYLHDIGFYLHYLDSPLLRQYVIVKNEWATEAVYRVIDDEKIGRSSGKFDWDDLHRIWQPRQEDIDRGDDFRYEDYQPQLLELMRKFKLCYPLKNDREFIAPTRLPIRPPEVYSWQPNDDLQLFVEYEFMPPGLLSRFIVSRFEDIADNRLLVWRDGVVFQWKKVRAEAQLLTREGKKTIALRAQGDPDERRIFITMLDDSLEKLHAETPGIKVERKIPCICEGCRVQPEPYFFKKSDLVRFKEKGWETIQCLVHGAPMEVEQLLGNVFAREREGQAENDNQPNDKNAFETNLHGPIKALRVFISYSHAYRAESQVFVTDFRAYTKIPGLDIAVFDDHEIPLGTDWDEYLQDKVAECDVLLLLVSQELMNSGYIQEKEFGAALKRLKAGSNLLIVPVYFAPCPFGDDKELSRLQFFKPHGDDFDNAKKGNNFSYIDLVKFRETDGMPLPNANRKHYMNALMQMLKPQLLKLRAD